MMPPLPDGAAPAKNVALFAKGRHYVGWLTAAYWVVLFVATHVPLPALPMQDVGSDKVIHVVAFAGLGFLAALWLAVGQRLHVVSVIGLLMILFAYAAADEWLQQFVNRTTDPKDWLADVIGATLGVAWVCVVQAIRSQSRPPLGDFANSPAADYDGSDR